MKASLLPPHVAPASADLLIIVDMINNITKKVTVGDLGAMLTPFMKNAVFSGARLTKTGSQSIANASGTKVAFDAETFDTDSYHSNSVNNTRITAPFSGYYAYSFIANWVGSWSGADTRYIETLYKNGASLQEIFDGGISQSGEPSLPVGDIIHLNAGDYIEMEIYQAQASPRDLYQGSSFSIAFLGT